MNNTTQPPLIDVPTDVVDVGDTESTSCQSLVPAAPTAVELALDEDAKRIRLPAAADGWRVFRRTGTRGRPPAVYGPGGATRIPLDAGYDDLRAHVNQAPGWYILRAVDVDGDILDEVPPAHVKVTPREPTAMAPIDTAHLDAFARLARTVENLASDRAARDKAADDAALEREKALIAALTRTNEREKALVDALIAATANAQTQTSRMMESAAQLLMASRATTEVASGLRLPATPPAPEPERGVFDFLSSPAGGAAVATLGSALKTALENKE